MHSVREGKAKQGKPIPMTLSSDQAQKYIRRIQQLRGNVACLACGEPKQVVLRNIFNIHGISALVSLPVVVVTCTHCAHLYFYSMKQLDE